MEPPRTFVSFSSTDIGRYHMMMAWNANENIDFNFKDFQLDEAINSKNPSYIKAVCKAKIRLTDTFILLIGNDTWTKTEFVQPEVEAAIEKGCRLIGMNLNDCRIKDWLCPWFFADKSAVFIPFSSRIAALAIEPQLFDPPLPGQTKDFYFYDHIYTGLGYQLIGNTAVLPEKPNPFAGGNRPSWAK
jgi:hypothetical protein